MKKTKKNREIEKNSIKYGKKLSGKKNKIKKLKFNTELKIFSFFPEFFKL